MRMSRRPAKVVKLNVLSLITNYHQLGLDHNIVEHNNFIGNFSVSGNISTLEHFGFKSAEGRSANSMQVVKDLAR